MMDKHPVTRAMLISPIAALAALPAISLLIIFEDSELWLTSWVETVFLVVIIATILCVILGLPAHFILQRIGLDSKRAYSTTGFLIPVIVLASGPIIFMDWQALTNLNNIKFTLFLALAGACVALTFRVLIKRS